MARSNEKFSRQDTGAIAETLLMVEKRPTPVSLIYVRSRLHVYETSRVGVPQTRNGYQITCLQLFLSNIHQVGSGLLPNTASACIISRGQVRLNVIPGAIQYSYQLPSAESLDNLQNYSMPSHTFIDTYLLSRLR